MTESTTPQTAEPVIPPTAERGTFVLRVRDRFEAAHHLRSYGGRPEPVHGHSWRVEVTIASPGLDDEGMACDFVAVKTALAELVAPFHHADINRVAPFDELSPTTEHLARYFFEELRTRTGAARAAAGAELAEVTVWEGPDCSATYRPTP